MIKRVLRVAIAGCLFLGLGLGLAAGCGGESGSASDEGRAETEEPSSTQEALSAAQKKRLGPAVRRLLAGDTLSQAPGIRKTEPNGSREGKDTYSVLVEGTGAEALREAGLPVTSAAGGIVTARFTTDQIRQAASLQDISKVRFPKQADPQ